MARDVSRSRTDGRNVRWPFVVLVLIVACIATWRMLQRDPLYRDTLRYGHALVDGNVSVLIATMVPEERGGCGVTEDNLRTLWRDFIKPRLDLGAPVGPASVDRLHSTAVFEQKVRYGNGLTVSRGVGLMETSEGGKTSVLFDLLMSAYRSEAQARTTTRLELLELYPTIANYVERDRSYFESLGLKGVYGPLKGVVPWKDWADSLRATHARGTQSGDGDEHVSPGPGQAY